MRQERKHMSNAEKPAATPELAKVAAERPWKSANLTMDSRSPSDSVSWMDELQDPERWDGLS